MNIFMLGWEFPPYISGGLGTACYGLTRGLASLGHHVIFVLPQPVESQFSTHVTLRSPTVREMNALHRSFHSSEFENVEFRAIASGLQPYTTPAPDDIVADVTRGVHTSESEHAVRTQTQGFVESTQTRTQAGGGSSGPGGHYAGDMFAEVQRYARIAVEIALNETFDVVHAHDWMTYSAGIAVAAATGKPLVVHVHSTEFDRSGEHVNQRIYDLERQGVHVAQRVIAVSHLTRNILLARYAAPADRVEVVYNAITNPENHDVITPPPIGKNERIILFLGRITMQKGPEYFVAAAKMVLEYEKDVRFVMAGSGDMIRRVIELAAELGIGHKFVFTGFLRGDDVARIFKMADLYVMPSVSEPFGIAPLEALSHDVPVLISKQSGVSEVLTHALKVDFWDTHEMANKIIAVLRHPPLQNTLREHGNFEIKRLTWEDSAQNCVNVYERAIQSSRR